MPADNFYSTISKNSKFISNSISFAFCHPLYFSYFIFFSPYLLKFVIFISFSPLFLTTALLVLLSVLASSLPHSKLGFLEAVVDKIQLRLNETDGEEEFLEFEDFEIYKIVFSDPPLIMEEDTVAVEVAERRLGRLFEESPAEIEIKQDFEKAVTSSETEMTSSISIAEAEMTSAIAVAETEMKSDLENASGELQKAETVLMTSLLTGHSSFTEKSSSSRFDSSSSFGSFESSEESTEAIEMNSQLNHTEFVKSQPVTSSVSGENQLLSRRLNDTTVEESQKSNPMTSSNSVILVINNKTVDNLLQVESSSSFGSYGSLRKETEWKRTLACKLFEERRNLELGEEGMDSLWESYETDNSGRNSQFKLTNKNKIKSKSEFKYFVDGENEDSDDEENESMSNGQLCCLKALKLSTGKMNLGMGKPNLVKISKALKGFSWLRHVGGKNGKKKKV